MYLGLLPSRPTWTNLYYECFQMPKQYYTHFSFHRFGVWKFSQCFTVQLLLDCSFVCCCHCALTIESVSQCLHNTHAHFALQYINVWCMGTSMTYGKCICVCIFFGWFLWMYWMRKEHMLYCLAVGLASAAYDYFDCSCSLRAGIICIDVLLSAIFIASRLFVVWMVGM